MQPLLLLLLQGAAGAASSGRAARLGGRLGAGGAGQLGAWVGARHGASVLPPREDHRDAAAPRGGAHCVKGAAAGRHARRRHAVRLEALVVGEATTGGHRRKGGRDKGEARGGHGAVRACCAAAGVRRGGGRTSGAAAEAGRRVGWADTRGTFTARCAPSHLMGCSSSRQGRTRSRRGEGSTEAVG